MHSPAVCASCTMCNVAERYASVTEPLWNITESLWNVAERYGTVTERYRLKRRGSTGCCGALGNIKERCGTLQKRYWTLQKRHSQDVTEESQSVSVAERRLIAERYGKLRNIAECRVLWILR